MYIFKLPITLLKLSRLLNRNLMPQLAGKNISDSTYLFLEEVVNVFFPGAIRSFAVLVTQ